MNFHLQETSKDRKRLNLGSAENAGDISKEQSFLPAMCKPVICVMALGSSSRKPGVPTVYSCNCFCLWLQLLFFLPLTGHSSGLS